MKDFYLKQSSAIQDGDFNPNDDGKLFAKQLVTAISRGEKHISLTLTGKSILALARELSQCILAGNDSKAKQEDDALLTKKKVMERLGVSSTTLWNWENDRYLLPVKIGRKIFYRLSDINKLLDGNNQ
jgi:predicted DNA-binding transcriptional regulator AlpA